MLGPVLRQLATLAGFTSSLPRAARSAVSRADEAHEASPPDAVSQVVSAVRTQGSNAQAGLIDESVLTTFLSERTFDRSQKVLGIFVRELAEKMERLKQSISAKDAVALRAVVHSARGSSMLLGAARLARESQHIEHKLHEAGGPNWDALAELATTMAETLAVYQALLASDLSERAMSGRTAANAM